MLVQVHSMCYTTNISILLGGGINALSKVAPLIVLNGCDFTRVGVRAGVSNTICYQPRVYTPPPPPMSRDAYKAFGGAIGGVGGQILAPPYGGPAGGAAGGGTADTCMT